MTKQVPAKSIKSRRRKSARAKPTVRGSTPDGSFYEIRGIIDEKFVGGKLLYKVDWVENPTTGERYDPTWEPAVNVTEAAIAAWETEKRRTQGAEPDRPHPSAGTDRQPVLSPSRRAKRQRAVSVPEEHERLLKRARTSFDSGYTSTDGDDEAGWALVESIPENKGKIVLEIPVPPEFNPSEYQIISLSQSAPSSQELPLPAPAASPAKCHDQARGQVSQRTIADSQDGFDSLRTQSSVTIAPTSAEAGPSHQTPQSPTGDNSQEADIDRQGVEIGGQTSCSDLEIPSRQPENSYHYTRPSFGLLEISAVQSVPHHDSLGRVGHSRGGSQSTGDNPWSQGFLTQPEYDLPLGFGGSELSGTSQVPARTTSRSQSEPQDLVPNSQSASALRAYSFPTATDSNLHSQAAQAVPPLDSNPGQIQSQTQEVSRPGEEEIVPDTVHKERRRSATSVSDQSVSQAPRGKRQRLASNSTGSTGPLDGDRRLPTPEPNKNVSQRHTALTAMMDGPPAEETPRSAVDLMRQLQADVFGTSPEFVGPRDTGSEAALTSPSAVLPGTDNIAHHLGGVPTREANNSSTAATSSKEPPLSAVEELNRGIGMGINMPTEHAVGSQRSMGYEQPLETVAPSDLTTSANHIAGIGDVLSSGDHQSLDEVADDPIPTSTNDEREQFPQEIDHDEQEDENRDRNFVVTLPMAANTRSIYLETIAENKATMIEFGEVFANSFSNLPDAELVAKMDRVFEQLLGLCDLPAYNDTLLELGTGAMMKHATGSNSKFSFVYEFLNGLWDINARVLILSQPGRVFDYLQAIVSAAEFPYTVLGQGDVAGQARGGMFVILAVAGQDLTMVQGGIDVVLAFDHAARSVELPATLGYDSISPIVLSLVVTYSLEHIDQQLLQQEPDLDGLERKNALNLATAAAKEHLKNPERGYPEPHEAAEIFANFLRSPEAGLAWEPHPLPAGVFELWLSSQDRVQESPNELQQAEVSNMSSSRKRRLDDVEEGTPKRTRLIDLQQPSRNVTPARMSDLLKRTLASHPANSRASTPVEVPVDQLERMADKIAELEDRLAAQNIIEAKTREHMTSLESQVQSYECTLQSLQTKFHDALHDRAEFEKERKAAVEKATAATERLEARNREVETLKDKVKLLESRLADANTTMANSAIPEIARFAQIEKEREEAFHTVQKLENKVRSTENELGYSRKAYQDKSNAHSELNQENRELRNKIVDLEKRASDNLLKIQQIHAQNEMAAVSAQIDDLRAMLENRERELERAKDELRNLRNNRRETRQGSVPRSPRPGVMSPRPGRGVGGGGGGGGGTGSRGTSPAPFMSSDGLSGMPVPGMTFFPPAGNVGRWGHLRD
ncbi:Citron Rho-interacting kinase [Madurella mycetomatis]|uniref:Citron Rho-interacting kinase n=1 Tax=Madurella mycetomatis TaxID=100816 RepID=A0A175WCB7_9PEZI|nr:Citron Rho-interacting kinase [Madurella mycetomatis]